MDRQVHARAEGEWQQALDLEKKLKATSRQVCAVCYAVAVAVAVLHHPGMPPWLCVVCLLPCHNGLKLHPSAFLSSSGWGPGGTQEAMWFASHRLLVLQHCCGLKASAHTLRHPALPAGMQGAVLHPPLHSMQQHNQPMSGQGVCAWLLLPDDGGVCLLHLCTWCVSCRKRSFVDKEVRSLRRQLRDTYESLLFLDAAFAAANDVEGQLWRSVFYTPIEEFRARIRKAEKEAQQSNGPVAVVSLLQHAGGAMFGIGGSAADDAGGYGMLCWGLPHADGVQDRQLLCAVVA